MNSQLDNKLNIHEHVLALIFVLGAIGQMLLDSKSVVDFYISFIIALLPIITLNLFPHKYNNALADIKSANQITYKWNNYINFTLRLILVSLLINLLLSCYTRHVRKLSYNYESKLLFFSDTGMKVLSWMLIHFISTACIVYISYLIINKILKEQLESEYCKRKIIIVSITCGVWATLFMTPAGTVGHHIREVLTKPSTTIITKEELSYPKNKPTDYYDQYLSTSNIETSKSIIGSTTVININTNISEHKEEMNPHKSFIYNSLLILSAGSILSVIFTYYLLMSLPKHKRKFILDNIDMLVIMLSLLHYSTSVITSVGNFKSDYKLLILIALSIQFTLLFYGVYRICLTTCMYFAKRGGT